MALDAEKRIPDTTLPANSFKDGDILYGSDMNRVVDTLKTAVNENYKDLRGIVKSGDDIYIEPIEGVVDAEGQPIDTVDGLIKWLYDNKILNEGKIYSLRINDLGQFEYYDGKDWKIATVGQQGDPGEGVPTGGLSGQFLRKQSDVSYDTEWADAYDKEQIDSKVNSLTTSVANLNNATGINLLKPTLGTKTSNGVTCTNNGDTYTVNGTASANAVFIFYSKTKNNFIGKKLLGCPHIKQGRSGPQLYISLWKQDDSWLKSIIDDGDGVIIDDGYYIEISIFIPSGYTCNNLVFKPMVTTDLNANYDDFVSYDDSLATNKVIKPKTIILGTTWTTDNTNGYVTQSVTLSGITSSDTPPVDVVLSGTLANMQTQQDEWGKILKVETSTDKLKFYASEPTTVSLSVIVKGV